MARARNIKPGFYKNEDLAECSVWARYIFPGLWMLADREGRLEDRPKRIKGELMPFDNMDVEPLLAELEARKFLVRYENSDGKFIQISKFLNHQTPHYSEKQSAIKPPELQETGSHHEAVKPREHQERSEKQPALKGGSQPPDSLNPDSLIPESRLSDSPNPDSGIKAIARAKRSPRPTTAGFDHFWASYPRKAGKPAAERAWRSLGPDDTLQAKMAASLEDQKQSAQWSDPQFIPHPSTWLNQRRWEDQQVSRGTLSDKNRQAAAEFVNNGMADGANA